jgi:predicted GIY-YIG superfamily endonuclease
VRYVYLLQSEAFAGQRYASITSDLIKRIAEHNGGRSPIRPNMRHGDW